MGEVFWFLNLHEEMQLGEIRSWYYEMKTEDRVLSLDFIIL